jgi:hypothetical protein
MPALRADRVGVVAGLILVVAVLLASCGGGAPSKADESAVGQAALKGSRMKLDSAAELCVGKSLVDDLGIDDARKAVAQSDITKMPTAQRKAAVAAFDRCVPSAAFAATFTGQLPAGTSNEELESCLAEQFRGKVGTVAAAISDPASDAATTKLFDNCQTHDLAIQVLKSGLTNGGVTAAVAECVVGQLTDLKLSDVLTQSKSLETQVETKAQACGAGGTSGATSTTIGGAK